MAIEVRRATPDDLPAVVSLTRRARRLRAEWEPEYFRPAADADRAHEAYLRELVGSDDRAVPRVVASDGEVVGCAVLLPLGDGWVVDDAAPADQGWWSDGMVELFRSVRERPAITCVPRADMRAAGCCSTVGLRVRSSYWLRRLDGERSAAPSDVTLVAGPDGLRAAPDHTFGAIDPEADGVTVLGGRSSGYAVLAASRPAPPVYDPGGTTALVDLVTGSRRGDLVDAVTAAAAERGDVQLVVVCADDDPALEDALVDRAFHRVVDVYRWPPVRD